MANKKADQPLLPLNKISKRSSSSVLSPESIITTYSPKRRVQQQFTGPGRTKQSFKAECDINNIMSRFQKTGVLDFRNKHEPRYADVSGINYQDAMHQVATARSMFEDLPAAIRAEFDNDPGKFLDFATDPENLPQMVEMGLATARPNAVGVEATPPASPPAAPAVEAPAAPQPLPAKPV